jgi:hypothetical protein
VTVRDKGLAAGLVFLVLVAAFGVYLGSRDLSPPDLRLPTPTRNCTVRAGAGAASVFLDATQMANAATIAAVGVRQAVPERGVVVALATAWQESKLENLGGGDRDSVGLFQQRPSQGWGPAEKLQDPRFAASRFYGSLKRVRGWEEMRVTEAAQRVQRSAYPEAYQQWVEKATVLAAALLGRATGAVACSVRGEPSVRGAAAAAALTDGLLLDWGRAAVSTTTGDLLGLAVAVGDPTSGWRYAHWLVANANDRGVKRVRFGDMQWDAHDGAWAKVNASAPADSVIAEVFAPV